MLPRIVWIGLVVAIASDARGQAERLGPTPPQGAARPRVVEVQASETIRSGRRAKTAGLTPTQANAELQAKRMMAEARLQGAEIQLQRLSTYNRGSLPSTNGFRPSQVLPPAPGIRPVTTGQPVQVFQPSSSFSHVFANTEAAQLQAQLEIAEIDAAQQAPAATPTPQPQTPAERQALEAKLQSTQFRLYLATTRLQRLQNMSNLTYSQLYQNLGEKAELEILQAELDQALIQRQLESGSQPGAN